MSPLDGPDGIEGVWRFFGMLTLEARGATKDWVGESQATLLWGCRGGAFGRETTPNHVTGADLALKPPDRCGAPVPCPARPARLTAETTHPIEKYRQQPTALDYFRP